MEDNERETMGETGMEQERAAWGCACACTCVHVSGTWGEEGSKMKQNKSNEERGKRQHANEYIFCG